MRDLDAHVLGDVRGHDQPTLLMAARAQTSAPARERHQELVATGAAANPRKAVTQIAAPKELRRSVGHDGTPESVPLLVPLGVDALELVEGAFDQPVERRLTRPPGPVDTSVNRGRARHVHPLAWGTVPALPTTRLPAEPAVTCRTCESTTRPPDDAGSTRHRHDDRVAGRSTPHLRSFRSTHARCRVEDRGTFVLQCLRALPRRAHA